MDAVPEVLGRSALVSLTATAIALAFGVPLGTWLALRRRRGRGALATVVNTGMAIPTVVVGLAVALLLWREQLASRPEFTSMLMLSLHRDTCRDRLLGRPART